MCLCLWEVLTPLGWINRRGPYKIRVCWWTSVTVTHFYASFFNFPLETPPDIQWHHWQDLWKSTTPTPQPHTFKKCLFCNLFLYKKGTIYITFIKSFRIIRYNITLLQEIGAPATIQVKNSRRRVHTVPFSQFNMVLFFLSHFFFKQRPVLHVPTTLTRQD